MAWNFRRGAAPQPLGGSLDGPGGARASPTSQAADIRLKTCTISAKPELRDLRSENVKGAVGVSIVDLHTVGTRATRRR